jgi:hypothetical protein
MQEGASTLGHTAEAYSRLPLLLGIGQTAIVVGKLFSKVDVASSGHRNGQLAISSHDSGCAVCTASMRDCASHVGLARCVNPEKTVTIGILSRSLEKNIVKVWERGLEIKMTLGLLNNF